MLEILVVGVMVALVVAYLMSRKKRATTAQQLKDLETSTRSYIEDLERTRTFPRTTVPGLHLAEGEFVIRHDRATLAEFTRARVGGAIGTRVRVAGIPIYLGGYKSVPNEELREVSIGDLVLTNRRLLYVGARNVIIPFDKLLSCQQIEAALVVSESNGKRPHVFVFNYAGLWNFLVTWAIKSRFTEARLPNHMHMAVTGQTPNLEVEVSFDEAAHGRLASLH